MCRTFLSKHAQRPPAYYTLLTFTGPCIVIYSYNKSQRDALILKFIFDKELYILRTDLLSIIRYQHNCMTNIYCCVYSVDTPDDGQ
jgi:hypothetical protein